MQSWLTIGSFIADRLRQAGEQFLLGHEDALVHRAELARDDVGVLELVALLAAHIGEADVVGAQILAPRPRPSGRR